MSGDRPQHLAGRIGTAMRAGRLEDAAALLQVYVNAKPHRAGEQFALASVLFSLGRAGQALPWLSRVVALAPGHVEAQLTLGRALLRRGRACEAEWSLRAALALKPDRFKALAALSACLNRQERWREAMPLLAQACAVRPRDARVRYEYGLALLAQSRLDEAAAHLAEAATLDPKWMQPRLAHSRALYELGEFPRAAELAEDAVLRDPASPDARHLIGLINFKRHHLASSCFRLWEAIALGPALAESHFFLGRSLNESNRQAEAAAAFAYTIDLRPDWAEAHYAWGVSLLRGDQIDAASAVLTKAVAGRPEWAAARFRLSTACLDLGHSTEAAAQQAAAACLDPENNGQHLTRAPWASAREGGIRSLEDHAIRHNLPRLSLPDEDRGVTPEFACLAARLDGATVLGQHPMIVAANGDLLVGGVGYSPEYMRDETWLFDKGWLLRGRKRHVITDPITRAELQPHLFLGAYSNFGHWLINNLSRLRYAEHHPVLAELPVVVPDTASARHMRWLELAGYSADRVTIVPSNTLTRFDAIWVPVTLHQHTRNPADHGMATGAARFLASLGQRIDPAPPTRRSKLYLMRGNMSRRRPLNEGAVIVALTALDFEVVDPAALSPDDQVRLVRRAEIVVGPMGASMTLIAFARPGTCVVELRVPGAPFDVFSYISAINGLSYRAVTCRRAHSSGQLLFDDFTVPVPALTHTVETLLGSARN